MTKQNQNQQIEKQIEKIEKKENQKENVAVTITAKSKKMKDLLYSFKDEFAKALPKMITPDKFIRTALTSFNKNPKLLDCTPVSVIACLLTSAQLGLSPDSTTGEAYLVPFENRKKKVTECQFILGYRGIVNLAMRSGMVKRFQARTVYDTDFFEYEFGLNEKLVHRPSGKGGNIKYFYAIIEYTNGGRMFEIMSIDEINLIRDMSANYKMAKMYNIPSVWDTYYKEMGMKTVLRRLGKLAPLSSEFQSAITLDEFSDLGYSQKLEINLLEKNNINNELKEEILEGIAQEQIIEEEEIIEKQNELKNKKIENTENGIFEMLNKENKK